MEEVIAEGLGLKKEKKGVRLREDVEKGVVRKVWRGYRGRKGVEKGDIGLWEREGF